MIHRNRTIYFVMGILLVMIAGAIGCSKTQSNAASTTATPAEVRVDVLRPSAIQQSLVLSGSVVPFRAVQLASPAEGPIVELRRREGDNVRRGDTLLVVGRKSAIDAQISSLVAVVHNEEANLARARELFEIEGNSRQRLDEIEATLESAKAQLAKAQEASKDFAIVAPWSGVVSQLFVEVGDFNYISPRKPLIEMYDPTSMVIRISVPEAHSMMLNLRAPVTVLLDAYPETNFAGTISRIYPFLDEKLRTRAIEVTVANEIQLIPGMFARVKLQTAKVESAIVAPTQALISTPEATVMVYVVVGGKAQKRTVITGIEEGDKVEITSGLQSGDSLIIFGVSGLSDGRSVRIAADKSLTQ